MNAIARMTRTAAIFFIASLPAATVAQTPLPNATPRIELKWLASLSFNPAAAPAGQAIIGTVTLLRPALKDLTVALNMPGATPDESGIYILDGVIIPARMTVPARSSSATFPVTTTQPAGAIAPRSFTVVAAYGSERVSASFTIIGTLTKPRP